MKLQKLQGSATSYFLIIPKALINAKNWKKGDEIAFKLDKRGDIVLQKLDEI